jgi:hypothetical protein
MRSDPGDVNVTAGALAVVRLGRVRRGLRFEVVAHNCRQIRIAPPTMSTHRSKSSATA